jgi:hypothetical protein
VNLAFMADIMSPLNNLNERLQGKTIFFPILFGLFLSFKSKLSLSEERLGKGELHHFARMQELMAKTKIQNFTNFLKQVFLLKQSYEGRSTDFQEDVNFVQLFSNPFSVLSTGVAIYPAHPQVDIAWKT